MHVDPGTFARQMMGALVRLTGLLVLAALIGWIVYNAT